MRYIKIKNGEIPSKKATVNQEVKEKKTKKEKKKKNKKEKSKEEQIETLDL